MRKHAILSASGAHRWLNCPPSARLEQQFPDETSAYAAEGTKAHKIAEGILLDKIDEPTPDEMNEMHEHVSRYVEVVMEKLTPGADLYVEQYLDFSPWVPEGFGTGDAVIVSDEAIEIVDLKYGKGVKIDAEGNPQLRLYALGAYNQFGALYDFDKVRVTIVQPRLDHISSEELTVEELLKWGEEIKPIAQKAFKGEGEFNPGPHCRFCKARRSCRARAEYHMNLARYEFKEPALLSVEEIAEILKQADDLAAWAKEVKEHALTLAFRDGVKIPGWKVVEGRSTRKIADEAALAEKLAAEGVDPFKKVMKTLTELEKTVGKKRFAELADGLIVKPPGKPTLVEEADKRPEVIPAALEFSE